jgi:hypothetical protein
MPSDHEDEASLSSGTMSKDQALAGLAELLQEAGETGPTITALQDAQWKVGMASSYMLLARSCWPLAALR